MIFEDIIVDRGSAEPGIAGSLGFGAEPVVRRLRAARVYYAGV
jgi:hypothetical protein